MSQLQEGFKGSFAKLVVVCATCKKEIVRQGDVMSCSCGDTKDYWILGTRCNDAYLKLSHFSRDHVSKLK